jgi:hypothetical protein
MFDFDRAFDLVKEIASCLPPSLWGVGVGHREYGGEIQNDLRIVFFAHQKRRPSDVADVESVPPQIGGFSTDVRHAHCIYQGIEDASVRFDPLVGGVRITASGKAAYSGTLGGVFRHLPTGALVAVTNRHVMTYNVAGVGLLHGQHGQIDGFQPEVTAADDLGEMFRSSSNLDCAAVRLNSSRAAPLETSLRDARGDGRLRIARIDTPRVNDDVFKVGARTGYTEGRVHVVGAGTMEIRPRDMGPTLIADHGDSGSIWCRREGIDVVAVGLHTGCNKNQPNVLYGIPMQEVAAMLQIAPI